MTKDNDAKLTEQLDEAIRTRVLADGESDEEGAPVAAIPASDKFGLAKQVGVELEDVEKRLDEICDKIKEDDPLAVAPRYRLRGEKSRSGKRSD